MQLNPALLPKFHGLDDGGDGSRRGADHLIIKLARRGTVKRVSAHRDVYTRQTSPLAHHKAVKGEVGSKLAKEFRTLYLELGRRAKVSCL